MPFMLKQSQIFISHALTNKAWKIGGHCCKYERFILVGFIGILNKFK